MPCCFKTWNTTEQLNHRKTCSGKEDKKQGEEGKLKAANAKIEIDKWYDQAIVLGFKPLQTFVNTYHQNEKIILNYFNSRYSSGPVEGLNNKIKVIKRRGFGFTNLRNFAGRIFLDFNFSRAFLGNLAATS